jgi:hypothetical protein
MAHHYSPRDFLRLAPNQLLAEYFEHRKLPIARLLSQEETDVHSVWENWEALEPAERTAIDAEFQVIHEMANEYGVQAILEEGRNFHEEDLEPTLAPMPGFHDKALWTFLNRERIFAVASQFRKADELPGRYWHKRLENVPGSLPRDDEQATRELADTLGAYFQAAEGRGRSCEVDVYRRDSRFYYFCFSEDYGRTQMEFEAGRLERRAHRPAFEVVFVYSPGDALDTHFPGPKKARQELEQIFGRVILGTELPPLGKDDRVYHLNALKDPRFDFRFPPASELTDVRIKELRLTVMGADFRRITAEVDPTMRRDAIHELLDHVLETTPGATREGVRIPLALCNVTRVGIRAYFTDPATRKVGTRTFHVSYPNACDLKQYGRDLLLRDMLVASGLEPRPAAAPLEP